MEPTRAHASFVTAQTCLGERPPLLSRSLSPEALIRDSVWNLGVGSKSYLRGVVRFFPSALKKCALPVLQQKSSAICIHFHSLRFFSIAMPNEWRYDPAWQKGPRATRGGPDGRTDGGSDGGGRKNELLSIVIEMTPLSAAKESRPSSASLPPSFPPSLTLSPSALARRPL